MPIVWIWVLVAGLYGLAIGSFLNVVIWRLPRGEGINAPTWSYCPNCQHRLGSLDLVPVLSYVLLGAKCRYCKSPISPRYPGVELLTGVLFALVAWFEFQAGGQWYDAVFFCLFTALLLCVFFIDLAHFIIPDGLSVLMVVLGLVHAAIAGTFLSSITGLLGYAAVIYLIGLLSYVYLVSVLDKRLPAGAAAGSYLRENAEDWAYVTVYYTGALAPPLRRYAERRWGTEPPLEGFTAEDIEADEDAGGMGGGDGKLAAAIGANLGLSLALGSLGFAIFLGAFAGVIVLARQRRRLGERVPIPFGPAMAAGALLALFYGHALAGWYVGIVRRAAAPPPAAVSALVNTKNTGLNPRALKGQAPTFVGEDFRLTERDARAFLLPILLPAQAGSCPFKARGFSPVSLLAPLPKKRLKTFRQSGNNPGKLTVMQQLPLSFASSAASGVTHGTHAPFHCPRLYAD